MNTPRIASIAALAASLFVVVMTIAQANGLPNGLASPIQTGACLAVEVTGDPRCSALVDLQTSVDR